MCDVKRATNISHRRSQIHRGFTLIEALVAGVLLAMVGAMVGLGASQAVRVSAETRDLERAAELLDATMTKIDLLGPSRIYTEGPTSGAFPPPDERFRWEATVESLIDGDLYEVTLKLRWRTGTGERSAELVTRLNDPVGSRNALLQWEDL